MSFSVKIDRRAFLQGIGGAALALPALDAMGAEVTEKTPRRFCAIYTANGMSLPKTEHGISEWHWFPSAERNGEFENLVVVAPATALGELRKDFSPLLQKRLFAEIVHDYAHQSNDYVYQHIKDSLLL